MILCHCHVFPLGRVLRRACSSVTFAEANMIPWQPDHEDPRPKITLPPTHWLQIGVREISICFQYGKSSTCFETSSFADIHKYAHVHHKSFSKATHLTSKHRRQPARCFRFIPPHPTMLGSKDPDLLEFRRRRLKFSPTNGMVGADRLDLSWSSQFQVNSQVNLIGGPPYLQSEIIVIILQRHAWNAENPGINHSNL